MPLLGLPVTSASLCGRTYTVSVERFMELRECMAENAGRCTHTAKRATNTQNGTSGT